MRLTAYFATFVAVAALCGCGGAAAPARTAYVDHLPPPEEPLVMNTGESGAYGGRFVTAGNTAPLTFNPVTNTSAYGTEIIARLFARLMRVDPATQLDTPYLATRWDLSADGTRATFHLRRGARFSDGHPITSEDVVFSLQVLLEPSVSGISRDTLQTNGEPFTFAAPDPLTVVVESPQPNGSLLTLIQTVFIIPKHVLEPALRAGTFNASYGLNSPPEQIVTSGAWRLKRHEPDARTVLTRNPYWFGVDAAGQRLPYLDELVFLVVPDQEATNLKFRVGEIDTVARPRSADYQWYREHQEEGNFTLYDLGPELSSWFMFFNLNEARGGRNGQGAAVGDVKYAWFKSAVFRRAVSSAIDRDAMISSIYYGDGVKYWSLSTPGDRVWAIPDVPHDDYDVTKARRLLTSIDMVDRNGDGQIEDAGHHPVTFSLKVTANNAVRVAAANFIRDDLAKVGIKLVLAPVEFNTLSSNISNDLQFEAAIIGRGAGRPEPALAAPWVRSTGSLRPWHIPQAEVDSPEQARVDWLIDHVIASTDLAQRQRWWAELQGIINAEGWLIWLPAQNLRTPVRNGFGNLRPSGTFSGASSSLWNAEEIFVKGGKRATH